jgi:AbrB family looped-hinge helix DNA binding protein
VELARITSKGQITLPIAIRRKLGLEKGDKVVFLEEQGRIVLLKSTAIALLELRKDMEGEADKVGLANEDAIIREIREIRKELWKKRDESDG